MSILTAYDKFIQQALKYGFSLFGLPKTGQTTELNPGDDGDLQKGYPKKPPRFKDNGDGTITDMATGLMWAKDADGEACNGGEALAWASAVNAGRALIFAGYSDWRLPNVKEIQSILDYGTDSPAIDPIFTNTKSDYYWSSTTYHVTPANAWSGRFANGDVFNSLKTTPRYMRPVRGGV